MSLIVIKKIIEMFMILLVGIIIYKGKIIDDVSTKHLSNVLLLLVSPLLIVQSYQIDFNKKLLYGLLWALLASFLTFLFMIIVSEFLFHGNKNRSSVEKIAEAEVADLLEVEEMNIPAAEAVYAFFRGIDIEKEKSAARSE